MKRSIKDWLVFLVLVLDEVVAFGVVLLILWAFNISIPLPIVIFIALVLGTFAFLFHKLVIPSFHKKQTTGSEGMMGMEAKVVEPLAPKGIIRVEGELWQARAVGENIAAGEDVEILEVKKLVLEVKRKKSELSD